ncbi:MAG: hypothetical protein HW387_555 [Parachlamydiales bacterium]|nr:hypothetical protein [Parachlamydiales bacterium]
MKTVRIAALSLIIFFTSALESSSVLQERLRTSKPGDYIVTESNKMISILAIRSLSQKSLILEEIDVPAGAVDPRPLSWGDWVRQTAPGHTSWSMIEIDLENHQLIECYSFTRSAWIQLSSQESVISTLLGLELESVPKNEQRKIGPEPMNGEIDMRKIWLPPMITDGQQLSDVAFEVYRAAWPHDGSDLAGNTVFLYFDCANHSPFPVWIQMNTAHATASLRIVDTGKNLPIHHRTLPRRIPEFIGPAQKTASGLSMTIKSPRYYQNFELYAIDLSSPDKEIFPITHSLISKDGENLHIEIAQIELQNNLQTNHRYTWLIVPAGHSESYSESPKSFLWKADE